MTTIKATLKTELELTEIDIRVSYLVDNSSKECIVLGFILKMIMYLKRRLNFDIFCTFHPFHCV